MELRENLHVELHSITKWVRMNKFVLKIAKTKCIVIGSRDVLTTLNLFIDKMSVEQVTEWVVTGCSI